MMKRRGGKRNEIPVLAACDSRRLHCAYRYRHISRGVGDTMIKHLVNRFEVRHDENEFRLSLFYKESQDAKPLFVARPVMPPEVALMIYYALRRNVQEYEAIWGKIKPRIRLGKFSEQFAMLCEMKGE